MMLQQPGDAVSVTDALGVRLLGKFLERHKVTTTDSDSSDPPFPSGWHQTILDARDNPLRRSVGFDLDSPRAGDVERDNLWLVQFVPPGRDIPFWAVVEESHPDMGKDDPDFASYDIAPYILTVYDHSVAALHSYFRQAARLEVWHPEENMEYWLDCDLSDAEWAWLEVQLDLAATTLDAHGLSLTIYLDTEEHAAVCIESTEAVRVETADEDHRIGAELLYDKSTGTHVRDARMIASTEEETLSDEWRDSIRAARGDALRRSVEFRHHDVVAGGGNGLLNLRLVPFVDPASGNRLWATEMEADGFSESMREGYIEVYDDEEFAERCYLVDAVDLAATDGGWKDCDLTDDEWRRAENALALDRTTMHAHGVSATVCREADGHVVVYVHCETGDVQVDQQVNASP